MRPPGRDLLPVLVLLGLFLLFGLGYALFPLFSSFVQHNDCIAGGSTNC